jgi:hypothetical protein
MFPKKGKIFPSRSQATAEEVSYAIAISVALRAELGGSHRAVKTIMQWTTANERTIKNWLAGTSGPHGKHLIDVIRHSDAALSAVLCLAGRREAMTVVNLEELRGRLAESLIELDRALGQRGHTI